MCTAYLKSCNKDVLKKLSEKRTEVLDHRKSMEKISDNLKSVTVLPIMFNSYKIEALLMTSNKKY